MARKLYGAILDLLALPKDANRGSAVASSSNRWQSVAMRALIGAAYLPEDANQVAVQIPNVDVMVGRRVGRAHHLHMCKNAHR